jgi:error-prone DNA polymerase
VGLRIERERAHRPFESIADFTARVALNKRELDALAYSGAFAAFGLTRREALWQAAAAERDPQSLFAGIDAVAGDENDRSAAARAPLPKMAPVEETLADYSSTGVTIGPHLMAHMRARLKARGILSAADLTGASNGSWVKIAGHVIVRQRPGTAKGFLFITMEDETGIANVIVTPDFFQQNRTLLHRAALLIAEGPLQKQDGVIHVRARRFAELKMSGAVPRSHDFH